MIYILRTYIYTALNDCTDQERDTVVVSHRSDYSPRALTPLYYEGTRAASINQHDSGLTRGQTRVVRCLLRGMLSIVACSPLRCKKTRVKKYTNKYFDAHVINSSSMVVYDCRLTEGSSAVIGQLFLARLSLRLQNAQPFS